MVIPFYGREGVVPGRPLDAMMNAVPPAARPWVSRVAGVDRFTSIFGALRQQSDPRLFTDRLLEALGVDWNVSSDVHAHIPPSGPVIVVANHPFGAVEGLVMASQLLRLRSDVRLMANHLLATIPEMRPYLIVVNPFGGEQAARDNVRGLRESLRWVKGGGVLGVFPAGEVAHFRWRDGRIVERPWNGVVAWLARESGAVVVPLHFRGTNGPLFHLAGLVHPRLRTALLPRELLNKNHRMVEAVMGRGVPAERLGVFDSDPEAARYLRFRTQLLSPHRRRPRRAPVSGLAGRLRPLAVATSAVAMERELATLGGNGCLLRHREWGVYVATPERIPNLLREIGRLREQTFRAVGEGSGKALDLDRFDPHYRHLILWNHSVGQMAGGYRLAFTDEVLPRRGARGLYSHTLFGYRRPLLERLTPGIELGRSFVRPEYQRTYQPLLLLWKGLGALVAHDPRRRLLFGTVSMSNEYATLSRGLLVRFFSEAGRMDPWSRWAVPRHPLRGWPGGGVDTQGARLPVPDVDTLSETISAIEADGKGLPVLLRQYLKLGGRILGFNIDSAFQSVLDALVVVDLVNTETRYLELYLGVEGTRRLLAAHTPGGKVILP